MTPALSHTALAQARSEDVRRALASAAHRQLLDERPDGTAIPRRGGPRAFLARRLTFANPHLHPQR